MFVPFLSSAISHHCVPEFSAKHAAAQDIVPRQWNDGNSPLTPARHVALKAPITARPGGTLIAAPGDPFVLSGGRKFEAHSGGGRRPHDPAMDCSNPPRREIRGHDGGRWPRRLEETPENEIRPSRAGRVDAENERPRRAGGHTRKKGSPKSDRHHVR